MFIVGTYVRTITVYIIVFSKSLIDHISHLEDLKIKIQKCCYLRNAPFLYNWDTSSKLLQKIYWSIRRQDPRTHPVYKKKRTVEMGN